MVEEQLERAKKILKDHRDELNLLANALLEHEMLDHEEINQVIKGVLITRAKKTRSILDKKVSDKNSDTIIANGEDQTQTEVSDGEDKSQPVKANSTDNNNESIDSNAENNSTNKE